ncbi:hypothetical protein AYL99_11768 [Fonsecaea erecta]|uniref:Uncharacterized protein n=1 Tax=Fonsecaea erecta TaxID=1367422 RepID=A0A178Z2H6_9EURO|nr:hypothetical protein AYL99_11768 [Fonsecaea erecta]OAP54008.1 hypothetical protein AYL99_11768 [Fonsecaea erecta]
MPTAATTGKGTPHAQGTQRKQSSGSTDEQPHWWFEAYVPDETEKIAATGAMSKTPGGKKARKGSAVTPATTKRARLTPQDAQPNESLSNDVNTSPSVAPSDKEANKKKPVSGVMAICVHCHAWLEAAMELRQKTDLSCVGGEPPVPDKAGEECQACATRGLPCSFVAGAQKGETDLEKARRLALREVDSMAKLAFAEAMLKGHLQQKEASPPLPTPEGVKDTGPVKQVEDSVEKYRATRLAEIDVTIAEQRRVRLEKLDVELAKERRARFEALHVDLETGRSSKFTALREEFQAMIKALKKKEAELTNMAQGLQEDVKNGMAQNEAQVWKTVQEWKSELSAEVKTQVEAGVAGIRVRSLTEMAQTRKIIQMSQQVNHLDERMRQVESTQTTLTTRTEEQIEPDEEELRSQSAPPAVEEQYQNPLINTPATTPELVGDQGRNVWVTQAMQQDAQAPVGAAILPALSHVSAALVPPLVPSQGWPSFPYNYDYSNCFNYSNYSGGYNLGYPPQEQQQQTHLITNG